MNTNGPSPRLATPNSPLVVGGSVDVSMATSGDYERWGWGRYKWLCQCYCPLPVLGESTLYPEGEEETLY